MGRTNVFLLTLGPDGQSCACPGAGQADLAAQPGRHPRQPAGGQGLAGVDGRRYHYVLLAALDEGGAASQADLSRSTAIDRSDMVAAVNELAGRGLVERSPDPDDRRRNVVSLTDAGRRYLQKLDRLLDRAQDDLLAPLSPAERRQLVDLLTRIVDHHARS